MSGVRQNFSPRLCRIHPLVLPLKLWRELLHKAAVEVVGRGQCLLVAGILLIYKSTEACLRNKFSHYLSMDSGFPLCVERRFFFFTPTLLVQFSALNLIDTSYFDRHSWGLLTTMISIIKGKKITFPFTFFLKEKRMDFFCHGQCKASYLQLHCQQEGVGALDAS